MWPSTHLTELQLASLRPLPISHSHTLSFDSPPLPSASNSFEFCTSLLTLPTFALLATLFLCDTIRVSLFLRPVLTHKMVLPVRLPLIYRPESYKMVSTSVHSMNLGPEMLIMSIPLAALFERVSNIFVCMTHSMEHCPKHGLERGFSRGIQQYSSWYSVSFGTVPTHQAGALP